MKKEFNWDLPADPDPKSDNYYNGIVSKELKDSSNIAETLLGLSAESQSRISLILSMKGSRPSLTG